MSRGEGTFSSGHGVNVRFTVMTAASDCPSVLKAIVYDVYRIPTPETSWDIDGGVPSDEYRFSCLIQGQNFYGVYNPQLRKGSLAFEYWDPYDPMDPRNQP
jgi:hypothetical protein